nr:hypothetical protein Iba_scaffold7622CG0020 [Ipomoea batatas]
MRFANSQRRGLRPAARTTATSDRQRALSRSRTADQPSPPRPATSPPLRDFDQRPALSETPPPRPRPRPLTSQLCSASVRRFTEARSQNATACRNSPLPPLTTVRRPPLIGAPPPAAHRPTPTTCRSSESPPSGYHLRSIDHCCTNYQSTKRLSSVHCPASRQSRTQESDSSLHEKTVDGVGRRAVCRLSSVHCPASRQSRTQESDSSLHEKTVDGVGRRAVVVQCPLSSKQAV